MNEDEYMDKRNSTRGRIINYMLNHPITSKAELSKELNISMPTVLTNVNELISQKLLTELGEYESTGGRKAKSIGINKSYRRAMGVVISANHLEMVLINLGSEIEKSSPGASEVLHGFFLLYAGEKGDNEIPEGKLCGRGTAGGRHCDSRYH